MRDVKGAWIVTVEDERQLEREEAFRGTTRAMGTGGEPSQVKLCSVFCGGMWLFCQLLQSEGYLSPPAVPPSCHTLPCSSLSWHPTPSAHHYLPVCVLHILHLQIISMEMSRLRLFKQHGPI